MTTVYFATNRNYLKRSKDFGPGFSDDGPGNLRFGRAEVKVAIDGTTVETVEVFPDAPKSGSQEVFRNLQDAMKSDCRDTFVFIHGFKVDFRRALCDGARLAQRLHGTAGYSANVVVFSWPSDGKLTAYHNDRHDAEASGYAFARGLLKLREFVVGIDGDAQCGRKLHLIAHSMGNYVLRHALQQGRKIAEGRPFPRLFDEIVMAAADEDHDAFEVDHKLASLPNMAQRITVYFNAGDVALKISDYTKGNPDRLGHDGPRLPHQVPAKVVLVDTSDVVKVDSHGYYEKDDPVARDIATVFLGVASETIGNRRFVAHANKFRLFV